MMEHLRAVILVVDDNDDIRRLTTLQLQSAGFEVKGAASGSEALDRAEERPDLILLDVMLPDIDGFEVCRRLKANSRTASIPVLHLSAAYRDTGDKVHGLDGGADGYLTHPVDPDELLATVKALLRLRRAEAQLRESQERYRRLVDAVLEGVWILDAEGRTTYVNEHMATMLGCTVHEMWGRPFDDFSPGPAKERGWILERPRHGMAQVHDVRLERKDLTRLSALVSTSPILDRDDRFMGVILLVTDLTERERGEEAERKAVALRSVAMLAAAAGHEINNPLMIIQGHLELMLRDEPLSPQWRERLTTAVEAARRIHEIIRHMAHITRLELEEARENLPQSIDLRRSS
jgi:PAS domain S-box-containing protein